MGSKPGNTGLLPFYGIFYLRANSGGRMMGKKEEKYSWQMGEANCSHFHAVLNAVWCFLGSA